MRTPPTLAALLACATLLGACTPMRWEHPAFGPEQANREAADCRQQAWVEAQRQAFVYGALGPPRLVRGRDGRIYYNPFSDFNDRQFAEMRLNDFCMRNKGFALVPVEAD